MVGVVVGEESRSGSRRGLSREQLRLEVARALRHVVDPFALEESRLAQLVSGERADRGCLGRGIALSTLLRQAVQGAVARLEQAGLRSHSDLLQAVISGSSIAAWAREHKVTREHVSRTLWRQTTAAVARELLARRSLVAPRG